MSSKAEVQERELAKLREIFEAVEPNKARLVEGLIEDAAFLKSENQALRELIGQTGFIRVHPDHPTLQRVVPATSQYLKNISCYAVVIKTLNSILQKNVVEQDDELDDFLGSEQKQSKYIDWENEQGG